MPPVGYKPTDGGAIVFKIRGGIPLYAGGFVGASVQMKCYGIDRAKR